LRCRKAGPCTLYLLLQRPPLPCLCLLCPLLPTSLSLLLSLLAERRELCAPAVLFSLALACLACCLPGATCSRRMTLLLPFFMPASLPAKLCTAATALVLVPLLHDVAGRETGLGVPSLSLFSGLCLLSCCLFCYLAVRRRVNVLASGEARRRQRMALGSLSGPVLSLLAFHHLYVYLGLRFLKHHMLHLPLRRSSCRRCLPPASTGGFVPTSIRSYICCTVFSRL